MKKKLMEQQKHRMMDLGPSRKTAKKKEKLIDLQTKREVEKQVPNRSDPIIPQSTSLLNDGVGPIAAEQSASLVNDGGGPIAAQQTALLVNGFVQNSAYLLNGGSINQPSAPLVNDDGSGLEVRKLFYSPAEETQSAEETMIEFDGEGITQLFEPLLNGHGSDVEEETPAEVDGKDEEWKEKKPNIEASSDPGIHESASLVDGGRSLVSDYTRGEHEERTIKVFVEDHGETTDTTEEMTKGVSMSEEEEPMKESTEWGAAFDKILNELGLVEHEMVKRVRAKWYASHVQILKELGMVEDDIDEDFLAEYFEQEKGLLKFDLDNESYMKGRWERGSSNEKEVDDKYKMNMDKEVVGKEEVDYTVEEDAEYEYEKEAKD